MTSQQHTPSIAIFMNSDLNCSLMAMKKSLQAVSCRVDFVAASTLSHTVKSHDIKRLNSSSDLQQYDLVIYQYGCDFSAIAPWLNNYDGKLMIQYGDDIALSNLRAYRHATTRVRQLELERQYFAEWVQVNCLRVYWLADSASAANHLVGWGVRDAIDNMAIVPRFMAFEEGRYADERSATHETNTCPAPETDSILVAGPYLPSTGHAVIIDIIKHYHDVISRNFRLQFIGKAYPELQVYKEGLNEHIRQCGLESCIQLSSSDEPIELEAFMIADIMLSMDNYQQYPTEQLHAQAMGLPVVTFSRSEEPLAVARSLEQAINDTCTRENIVLSGYRNISKNYTLERVEQTFLSSVITALGQ